jgi:hypothetical protein
MTLSITTVSIATLSITIKTHGPLQNETTCRVLLSIVIQSVSFKIVSVVMQNVIMLSVEAPLCPMLLQAVSIV